MSCFVDTSAFLAVLARDDDRHAQAKVVWCALLEARTPLVTSSYVLAETVAILQHRLGIAAVRVFQEDVYPVLTIAWLDATLHGKSMAGVLAAGRKDLSLTDCASFEVIRQRGIRRVFAFDRHFREQGFDVIP